MSGFEEQIDYQNLVEQIGNTYQSAKTNIINAVNIEMLKAYWAIGKYIVEFEKEAAIKQNMGKPY